MGFGVLAKGRPDPKVLKSAIRVIFSHLKKAESFFYRQYLNKRSDITERQNVQPAF